jgi:hypothetical protein
MRAIYVKRHGGFNPMTCVVPPGWAWLFSGVFLAAARVMSPCGRGEASRDVRGLGFLSHPALSRVALKR